MKAGSTAVRAGIAGQKPMPAKKVAASPTKAIPEVRGARDSFSKVSVSLPDSLTRSIRQLVGPGRFSAYVTAAVERQLELDRLAELVAGIEERRGGPIPEELMAEAEAAWHGE